MSAGEVASLLSHERGAYLRKVVMAEEHEEGLLG